MAIFEEVHLERERQDKKYPDCVHLPDGTGGAGRDLLRQLAQALCDRAQRDGKLTHMHILEEEFTEAMAETNQTNLRKELVQIAAVAVKWIEDLDHRRAGGG